LQTNEAVVPDGWPLTLGGNGLVLQLGELEASALRLGECYLCIRSAAATTATATATAIATATATATATAGTTSLSVSDAASAGEAVERNTVEVSRVSSFICFLLLILSLLDRQGSTQDR